MGEEIKEQDSTVWVRPDLTAGVKGRCRAAHIQAKVLEAFNLSAIDTGSDGLIFILQMGVLNEGLCQSFLGGPVASRSSSNWNVCGKTGDEWKTALTAFHSSDRPTLAAREEMNDQRHGFSRGDP